MKALIEKFKPAVIETCKNILYGVGAIAATSIALAVIGLVFQVESEVKLIASYLNYVIAVLGAVVVGKFIRKLRG